jgi:ATP-binding cassette subfamily B protein
MTVSLMVNPLCDKHSLFAYARHFIKPYRWYFCCALALLMVSAITVLSAGYALRVLIDHGFAAHNILFLNRSFCILLGGSIVLAAAAFGRTALTAWLGEKIIADVRCALFQHFLCVDRVLFEQQQIGDLLGRLQDDTQHILVLVRNVGAVFVRSCIQLFGGGILLFVTSPKLTGLVFLIVPVILVPIRLLGRRVRQLAHAVQEGQGNVHAYATEILGALMDVQLFQNERYVFNRFQGLIAENWCLLKRRIVVRSLLIATVIALAFSAISTVIWIGGHDVFSGTLTAGALSAFVFYAVVVGGSLNQMAELWGDCQAAFGAFDRIIEALQLQPDIVATTAMPVMPVVPVMSATGLTPMTEMISARQRAIVHQPGLQQPESIEFQRVTFAYPSRPAQPALRDISFHLKRGQKIALVGPSGAGKTTIFHLITRLYDPQQGIITIDGKPLKEFALSEVRRLFSIVPQEPVIFNATVFENIAFGLPEAHAAAVLQAARDAAVDEFVCQLPQGFHTLVGERGVRLSGGQKQRLAIARALLRPAPILLMDEATNALDAASEALIQQALTRLTAENRTALIIAHRFSTILKADQILVLDQGRIVQKGTHQTLMAQPGLYRTLAEKQYFGERVAQHGT